jgi:hypothetical protein
MKRDFLVGKPKYFGAQSTSGHNLHKVLFMRFFSLTQLTSKRKISFGSAAFLLGACLLNTGSAQAVGWFSNGGSPVGYKCNLTDPDCFTSNSPTLDDKFVTMISRSTTFLANTDVVEFTGPDAGDPNTPWHLTLDFNPNRGGAANISDTGYLMYKITITDPTKYFDQVKLGNTSSITNGNYTITKNLYSDAGFTNLVLPLNSLFNPPTPSGASVSSANLQTLYVRDDYDVQTTSNGVIDNLQNSFGQKSQTTGVPGPLPLFGLGAAFGMSRQLRKRIKGSTLA